MKEKLQEIKEQAMKRILEADNLDKLNDVRIAFLGKKGELPVVQIHLAPAIEAEVQQQDVVRLRLCQGPDLGIDPVEG